MIEYETIKRFHARYTKPTFGCWEWQGCLDQGGYGRVTINNKSRPAHRMALKFEGRDLPDGKVVMHLCNNRRCVKPNHLEVGTALTNARQRQRELRSAIGERSPLAKMNELQARVVKRLHLLEGWDCAKIARKFGMNRSGNGS